jgi:dihydropteroate synthase
LGASRKSLIDKIIPSKVEERLPGTLAIHLKGIAEGASIIRAHDVKEHIQAIEVYKSINKALI